MRVSKKKPQGPELDGQARKHPPGHPDSFFITPGHAVILSRCQDTSNGDLGL